MHGGQSDNGCVSRYLLYINGPGLKTVTDFNFPTVLKHAYIWKLVWQLDNCQYALSFSKANFGVWLHVCR